MNSKEELYHSNKTWYDYLPERKYMILNFLPTCTGNTLSVGVHEFNKNDEVCCKKNCNYETIDIDNRCVSFGSSYKHTTIDFLDYTPNYKFNNILLFGVLGIYNGCGGYNYTMHNKEDKLIKQVDNLLEVGGRVLLGPDVNPNSGAGKNSYSTVNYWSNLIKTNEILKEKFELIVNFKGRSNMIIILTKIS